MSNRKDRPAARRAALQILYSSAITDLTPDEIIARGELPDESGVLNDYAVRLLRGVQEYGAEIDELLEQCSDNWAIDRMPLVDRGIMRVAVYEMCHVDEVPVSVAINEAVELAKDFGGEDESHRFVNGVLGQAAKLIEQGWTPSTQGSEAAESEA